MALLDYHELQAQDVPTCLGRLRVRSVGEGPAMVFWSSLLMDARMWMAQARYFSLRYRVVLINPPGHGDSAALSRAFTFAECARCVSEVLDGD